jgi:hypothetical protein
MERGYFYGKNQKNLLDVVKKYLLGGMDEARNHGSISHLFFRVT